MHGAGLPEGFHTVTPNAVVGSVDRAVAFCLEVLGAREILRLHGPDGKVVHCELAIGDSRLNLAEPMPGWPEHPLLAQVFVADADAVFAAAVRAGARVLSPVEDTFFGSREGRVADPSGNVWTLATRREPVPGAEELQRRLDAAWGQA